MFPSLRLMLAAMLSALVIMVIVSSALISMRRPDTLVLNPLGSRPLTASWQNDDARSFDARFGPEAMLVNASVQLPPANPSVVRPAPRPEFVAIVTPTVDTKTVEPSQPAAAPETTTAAAATMPAEPTLALTPITVTPPVVVSTAPQAEAPIITAPATVAPAVAAPTVVATLNVSTIDAAKVEPNIVVAAVAAAVAPMPVPAKDPQIATDAPAQPGEQMAALLPAAPADARPSFVDTSRPEPIIKPAIKRRAQIKRPKKRVVRAPAPAAKPAAPTNPFAALFGSAP